MQLDVTAMLAPFDGGSPCGGDIEYDPAFIELETLARGKAESQVGDSIIASEEPDYVEMARIAEEILGRSKDLRVAVYLAQAALRLDGPVPFAEVLAYIRGCLETYWDDVHPGLDPDDDNDPTMRVNAVLGLSKTKQTEGEVYRALRLAPLTDSRSFGQLSLRDIMVATGEIAPASGETPKDQITVAAAFKETPPERCAAVRAAVAEARAQVKAIDAIFMDRIGAQGPDLDGLDELLQRVQQALDGYAGDESGANVAASAAGGVPGPAQTRQVQGGGAAGAINGTGDVVRVLERIVDYYERNEPSSPIPLLMKRAKRLVNADFTTIIKDMAKGGLNQVQTIAGASGADDDDD
jgi:type VI secretion system protein ImpA